MTQTSAAQPPAGAVQRPVTDGRRRLRWHAGDGRRRWAIGVRFLFTIDAGDGGWSLRAEPILVAPDGTCFVDRRPESAQVSQHRTLAPASAHAQAMESGQL